MAIVSIATGTDYAISVDTQDTGVSIGKVTYPISALALNVTPVGAAKRAFIVIIASGQQIVSFSNVVGSPDAANTYNGSSNINTIITALEATFGLPTGGGGGTSNVNVVSSVLPTGAATEATLATLANGGAQAIASSTVAANGTVAAGAYSVSFEPSYDFVGTIDGVVVNGDTAVKTITADSRKTLPAINYTRSAGSLTITRLA